MLPEETSLLKEEYFHLQKTVQDFDQRGLTIKAWSVTVSLAGIAASFNKDGSTLLCLLAAAGSFSFWLIEALWKSFQQCFYPRLLAIENAFLNTRSEKPLQISTQWNKAFRKRTFRRFFKVFFWPHVMLPHVLIVIGGLLIWVYRR
jgi:hypothetical protein